MHDTPVIKQSRLHSTSPSNKTEAQYEFLFVDVSGKIEKKYATYQEQIRGHVMRHSHRVKKAAARARSAAAEENNICNLSCFCRFNSLNGSSDLRYHEEVMCEHAAAHMYQDPTNTNRDFSLRPHGDQFDTVSLELRPYMLKLLNLCKLESLITLHVLY